MAKSPVTTIKRKTFGSIVSYFKDGKYKELFLAGALTAASTAVLGPLKHAKWLVAAKTFVGALVGMRAGKTLEGGYDNVYDKTGGAIKRHINSGKKKKAKEKKNQPFVDVKDYYTLDTEANKASLNSRLDPQEAPELRLLTQEESDMNYDDGKTVDAETDAWLEESIVRSLSQPQPSHGFPINDSMMSFYHLKSGLVLLTHFNEAAKNTTVYALHRPELALGDDSPLSKFSIRKMKESGIVKIEQKVHLPADKNGKSKEVLGQIFNEEFIEKTKERIGLAEEKEEGGENHKMKTMIEEEFGAEISGLLDSKDNMTAPTKEEKKQTLQHIHWLFNTRLAPNTEKHERADALAHVAKTQSPWAGTAWDEEDKEDEATKAMTEEEKLIARLTKSFEGMEIPPLRPAISSLSLTQD